MRVTDGWVCAFWGIERVFGKCSIEAIERLERSWTPRSRVHLVRTGLS